MEGIVTLPPTAPAPMAIGGVGTLLTMITATAPCVSAASTLNPNSHSPLLITTIFPTNEGPFVILSHPSLGSVETPASSSNTKAKSAVRGTKGNPGPKFALVAV